MFGSKDFYDQCPSYKNAIKNLEKELGACGLYDAEKKEDIILKFCTQYFLPAKYGKDLIRAFGCDVTLFDHISRQIPQQFYFSQKGREDFKHGASKTAKNQLSFPHSRLNECLTKIEMKLHKPLPNELVKLYKTNKEWYEKLKAVQYDVDAWFQLMWKYEIDCGNEKFVQEKIESRLSKNIFDVKLFKHFLVYQRHHDKQEMLQLYSRYCRFYLEDVEMKEEYKAEVEKHGPVYVQWKNIFEFEKFGKPQKANPVATTAVGNIRLLDYDSDSDGETFSLSIPQNRIQRKRPGSFAAKRMITPKIRKLSQKFYSIDQPRLQMFPFRDSLMQYILENALSNHTILRKLHQTCKYFFSIRPNPICYRLGPNPESNIEVTGFFQESLNIGDITEKVERELKQHGSQLCKNYWITTSFNAKSLLPKFSRQIISNIHRCDAKYISIDCSLSSEELKILIGSGNVVVFDWKNYSDLEFPKLEEITQYLPKIEKLSISCASFTPETCEKLMNQIFSSKIYSLQLYITGEPFSASDFLAFCVNNRATRFDLNVTFHSHFENRFPFINEFRNVMKEYENATAKTCCKIR